MQTERLPYRDSDYAVRVVQELTTDGGMVYSAWYEELPGCESQGDTEIEARDNLKDAFALYMTDLQRRGLSIPAPRQSQVREVYSHFVMQVPIAHASSTIQYGPARGAEIQTLTVASGAR